MLKSEPSFASLLVKQSPGMHYGHGWIAGKEGKRWLAEPLTVRIIKRAENKAAEIVRFFNYSYCPLYY